MLLAIDVGNSDITLGINSSDRWNNVEDPFRDRSAPDVLQPEDPGLFL